MAPPPELTQPAYLFEVVRHLYRWHLDETEVERVVASKRFVFWVRRLEVRLDPGDQSVLGEILLPQLNLSVKVKKADYRIEEMDTVVKSEAFKITQVLRGQVPARLPQAGLVVETDMKVMMDYLFRTRNQRDYPDAALIERLRGALRQQAAKEGVLPVGAAASEHVVHLAPLSPVANETWVFWEAGRKLLYFASDLDLANPAVWQHQTLMVRIFDLDQQVVVSHEEAPGSNRFLTRYQVSRASNSGHFSKRLEDRNLQLATEPYGNGNFDPFTFAKPAGLIMGEYWVGDTQINPSVKHASSVAHVYGHNVVGAEALTATPSQAGWRNQPRQWKPFADHAMTLGINRIIYHRFAHQPWTTNVLPGMTMGPWGSHVDRGNTIWPYMPAWNEYLSRCPFILQSDTFVGDVLVFTGEDSPQSYAGEGQSIPTVSVGYDYDFIGLDPLKSLSVKDGRLILPNGAAYALLALPNTEAMTLPLARKIRQLVDAGATIVGPKPLRRAQA